MAQCNEESLSAEERKQEENGRKEAAKEIVKLIDNIDRIGELSTELDILIYTIKKKYGV